MKSTLQVLLLLCIAFSGNSQIINTIAGTGVMGYSGDGGPALAASFTGCIYITTDHKGNIYVTDQGNNRIRRIDTSGIISTFAGTGILGYSGDGGPAMMAQIKHPYGITADRWGNIYIADNNFVIRKVDTTGIITTIAGTGVMGYGGDGGPALLASMNNISGIATDSTGNIFIVDQTNQRIRKIDTGGIITSVVGNGVSSFSGDGGPATLASLSLPSDIAVDQYGNLFIADYNNNRIRKVNPLGIISTVAGSGVAGYGGDGGLATSAQIHRPLGVKVDHDGNIYITDDYCHRVRKINTAGVITTIAGTGTLGNTGDHCLGTAAQTQALMGLDVDQAGNVSFCSGHKVRKLSKDNAPIFIGGPVQNVSMCRNTMLNLDTVLAITDVDTMQSINWNPITLPSHGVLAGTYSSVTTPGAMIPVGLSYVPTTGYVGSDSFVVVTTECGNGADTTWVRVSIDSTTVAPMLYGPDSVCIGDTISLSSAVTGGNWYSSDTSIIRVTAAGTATGVHIGTAMITYTITNGCGTTTTMMPMTVISGACDTKVKSSTFNGRNLTVSPNPNQGIFTINLPKGANCCGPIVITDVTGQVVRTIAIVNSNGSQHINADLPPGVYILSLATQDGRYVSKLVIK